MCKVQFITNKTERYSHMDSARAALEGGCRWIQLRMKDVEDDEIEAVASELLVLCRSCNATFIIDDKVEIALKIRADGVHLGQNDMPLKEARKMLGRGYIIGGTANTIEDVISLSVDGADYIGCGPFRFTATKKKLSPVLGIESYRNIVNKMHEMSINIPIFAIGGINAEDLDELKSTGINGIALSGSVLRADNPREEMRKIIAKIKTLNF